MRLIETIEIAIAVLSFGVIAALVSSPMQDLDKGAVVHSHMVTSLILCIFLLFDFARRVR